MKDLTTYFRRNTTSTPQSAESELWNSNSDKSASPKGKRKKKQSAEQIAHVTSDEANEDYSSAKLCETTKRKLPVLRNKNIKRDLRIVNTSDSETDHDEKIVRKNSRQKSAIKCEKPVNKLDMYYFTDNNRSNSTNLSSTANANELFEFSKSKTSNMRTLKGVLLKDCLDSSSRSETVKQFKQTGDNKRKKTIGSDDSDCEKSDSSGSLFNFNPKSSSKTYGKSPRMREPREENNLFNYFSKADKTVTKEVARIEDSPVNCLKRVKVVVQVHSPPKVRHKLSKPNEATKENLSPIVKIVRADVVKSFNFDDIKVIRTELAHFDDVFDNGKNKTKSEVVWKTEKCESLKVVHDGSDSDSAAIFTNQKPSAKINVKNESNASETSQSPAICCSGKRVSFAELKKSVQTDNKSKHLKKLTVKNRVSFNDTSKSPEKSRTTNTYPAGSEIYSCLERAKTSEKSAVLEERKSVVSETSSQSKSSGNDSDSSCVSSSSKKQPWKMRVKFVSSGKHKASKKLKPRNKTIGEEPVKKERATSSKKSQNHYSSADSIKTESESENEKPTLPTQKVSCGSEAPGKSSKHNQLEVIKKNSSSTEKDLNVTESTPKEKKLAPLFCKQYDKTKKKPANAINEARRLFLDSGLPNVIKKKMAEQKSSTGEESSYDYKFPEITHVQQKINSFVWNLPKVIELKMKSKGEPMVVPESSSFSTFLSKEAELKKYVSYETSFDVKYEITMLKKLEPDVNVADIYSSVKRLFKEAENTDSNICWTDKYKPTNYGDLIGNATCLLRLKEWIESHKRLKSNFDGVSSSEEFLDSDDSSSSMSTRNNIALLVGPPGCGKTCAVYMLANELGFKVLEVNAASNRNGKRILDELLEATQSHRVKRTIFDKAEKSPAKKKKKRKRDDESRTEKKTMSLILIEDADILFENHDDGFLSALNSLAARSKRPLVFTMNDLNYPHLSKYNNARNLILKFAYPSQSLMNFCVDVWLRVIALIEGVKLSDEVLIDLFHVAGLDVRRNLLQLQMLISSRLCYSKLNGEQIFYNEWWRQQINSAPNGQSQNRKPVTERKTNLFSPERDTFSAESSDNECEPVTVNINEIDRKANRKVLDECAAFLETVAVLGSFGISQYQKVISPCADHLIHVHQNEHASQLSADIASFLKTKLFSKFSDSECLVSFDNYYSFIRKNKRIKSVTESTLSYLQLAPGNSYAKYCDYLPTVRAIARIEDGKLNHCTKRSNRYFSYLKSINIDISSHETDFLRKSFL